MTAVKLTEKGSKDLRDLIEFTQKGVGWKRFDKARERFRKNFERRALRVLAAYPPERSLSRKFRWSLDPEKDAAARGWFFANYPEGYTRTFELGRGWKVTVTVTVAGFGVTMSNAADAASYVHGSDEYEQVPGHADTGWAESQDTFIQLAAIAETELNCELDAFIKELNR